MSNRELIERLRYNAGRQFVTPAILYESADALELADKRIAELERCKSCGANGTTAPCAYPSERAKELERKLAVAREALRHAGDEPNLDRARKIADAALAQIGGE